MPFNPDAYIAEKEEAAKGFDPDSYLASKGVTMEKPSIFKRYGGALPIAGAVVGGMAGNVPGAALGGAGGEAFRQLLGRSLGEKSPGTSMEAAKGIGMEGAISGVTEGATKLLGMAAKPLAEPVGNVLSRAGKSGSKLVEAVTGLKVPDVMQAAKQGVKTYLAPGMERAQEIFGNALEKAGVKARPPLNQILDPQLGVARKIALEVGKKLERGEVLTAEEALRARQSVDRIYTATPIRDRATRTHLLDIRKSFDKALSNQSGDLAEASRLYRKAIVKSNLLSPLKMTKQGVYSQAIPLISTALGAAVTSSQGPKKGIMATTLGLGATSPLLWGAGITTGADLLRLAGSSASRRALVQAAIRKLIRDKSPK